MTQGILPFSDPPFLGRSSLFVPGGERYAQRDRSYGNWHRTGSIARFLPERRAKSLTMLDLDSVLFAEYEHPCNLPLCLVEVAQDVGQDKPAAVMQKLAELAGLPAYVALYRTSLSANPANPQWPDIDQFRVRRLWPQPEASWRVLTPQQWADALVRIRGWQLKKFEAQEAANDPAF